MINKIEQIFSSVASPKAFAEGYLDHLKSVLDGLDTGSIASFIEVLKDARDAGKRIFFIGNGGSAATASHFANDLSVGTRAWDKPYRAVALTDNVAILTALGNDHGYDDIFLLQLKTQAVAGDLLVAISASGNSPNILKAVTYANNEGIISIGLTGFDGGALKKLSKLAVHVPTGKGEYGPVEDVHMIFDHLVAGYLMLDCRKNA